MMSEREIRGYHYTHKKRYQAMSTFGLVGGTTLIDEVSRQSMRASDEIAKHYFRAAKKGILNLPDEFYQPVIFALLEPESWRNNREFPLIWYQLWNFVDRYELWIPPDTVLLSFEVLSTDKAYILDRAHVFREEGRRPIERYRRYYDSRVPAFDYDGSYCLPELVIWGRIKSDRLRPEEMSPSLKEEIRKMRAVRKVDQILPILVEGYEGDPLVLRNKFIELLTE